jgi:hypothetical protein
MDVITSADAFVEHYNSALVDIYQCIKELRVAVHEKQKDRAIQLMAELRSLFSVGIYKCDVYGPYVSNYISTKLEAPQPIEVVQNTNVVKPDNHMYHENDD